MPGPNLPQQTAVTPRVPLAVGSTIPQPLATTPLQAPNLPGSPTPPPLNWQAPTIGPAPTATPFGSFTAPTAADMSSDPGVQFRLDQANRGANRSAAAHGTLLSGGFQTSLAKLNQGLASQEYGNLYDRALRTYGTNRDTNQQNFGQSLGSYQAGTGATLDASRLGLAGETAGYDRAYGAGRDAYGDARDAAMTQTGGINANAQAQDAFQQSMERYRAAVEAARQQPLSAPRPALPGSPGVFGRR